MLFRRIYDTRLSQASYLIGSSTTGAALVIDPARDITPYLEAAAKDGLRIEQVAETHIHADFVSGARELAAATGAKLLLSAEGGPDWQYAYAAGDGATLLHDGDVITVGDVRITVWHTPGHTPEHVAFLVDDAKHNPVALISGDFLFVGDVGRPDLLERAAGVADSKEKAARQLFHSLQRLRTLGDEVQVWPGHGAGSACGKALGAAPSSTLGHERQTNWAAQIGDVDTFVATVLDGQPAPPPYFAHMKRVNREGPAVLGTRLPPPTLAADRLDAALRSGTVLDVRSVSEYAAGHIPGTISIPLGSGFTKWAGWLLQQDRPLYLIASKPASAASAQQALASIGWDRIEGAFGPEVIEAAQAAGRIAATNQVPMHDVIGLQRQGTLVVDVRDPGEWDAGHLDGAVHHPLGTLHRTMADVDRSVPVAVHCLGGGRSAIGASLLEEMGFASVTDLVGGWNDRPRG